MTERLYQTEANENILSALTTNQRIMFSMATGLGKTIIITRLIKQILSQNKRVIFIAHRRELIKQAWDTFHKNGITSGIIQANIKPNYSLQCQVGSIQTMIRRSLPEADFIFIDEAHHCLEDNSYGKVLAQFPNAKVVGVTATPYRLAGKGFTKIFDCLIESLQLAEGIDQGYLVPLRYFACQSPNLSKIKVTKGEYSEEDAAKAMELVPIVDSYLEHANGKYGICFAVNVKHSKNIVDQYLKAGIRAEHLDANTPLDIRAAIFKRFIDRVTQIIVNVGIATEGVDLPGVEFIQCCRPTKSLSLYFQMIGRGTRVDNNIIKDAISDEQRRFLISCSAKPHCIILDNAGLRTDHRIMPHHRIDWQYHFVGSRKQKPAITELIEIFVAEDAEGREIRTKIPKEIEGLKLIEIIHELPEQLNDVSCLREFDRLLGLYRNLRQIQKPGFAAYFQFKEFCKKNNFVMSQQIWDYLKLKLSFSEAASQIVANYQKKKNFVSQRYKDNDALFLNSKIHQHETMELKALSLNGVPDGFLRKEQKKYEEEQLTITQ